WYLEKQLKQLQKEEYLPDAITYAGNGEPTLHPDFPVIVDDTLALRDTYAPEALVTVLSNASMLHHEEIFQALLRLDNNIQKLDTGIGKTFRLVNNPIQSVNYDELIQNLKRFQGEVIIQTMFLRGQFHGKQFDNTTEEEVSAWVDKLKEIRPKSVMIYPIARATPLHNIKKIAIFELEKIAERVRAAGIEVEVYQ
ncbi:MAG: radical SAM protein, partial [Bacteroidia bacterium]|nr:radical SAM protein [Bacteroidia bacterium]